MSERGRQPSAEGRRLLDRGVVLISQRGSISERGSSSTSSETAKAAREVAAPQQGVLRCTSGAPLGLKGCAIVSWYRHLLSKYASGVWQCYHLHNNALFMHKRYGTYFIQKIEYKSNNSFSPMNENKLSKLDVLKSFSFSVGSSKPSAKLSKACEPGGQI